MPEVVSTVAQSTAMPITRAPAAAQTDPDDGILRGRTTAAEWILLSSIALCILDGAIRKWVLRDSESLIRYAPYFAKDIAFLLLLLIARPKRISEQERRLGSFLKIGLPLCAVGALGSAIANWSNVNAIGSALTIRSIFVLPLVALLVVPRLRNVKLHRVALFLGLFTMVNAALGMLQYSSPRDDPINYYASKDTETVVFDQNVRAMGTFSYISGYGTLAIVGAWAGTVLMSYGARRRSYFAAGILIGASAYLCALLSISRSPTVIVIVIFGVWLLSARQALQNLFRVSGAVALLALVLFALGRGSIFQRASDTLLARHEEAADTEQRLTPAFAEMMEQVKVVPLGDGFGSEQVGGTFVETGVMTFRSSESQFSRIVMEMGALGLIGFLIVCGGLWRALYCAQRDTSDPALRRSIIVGWAMIMWLLYGNVVFDHVASFFVWAIAALLLAKAEHHSAHGLARVRQA